MTTAAQLCVKWLRKRVAWTTGGVQVPARIHDARINRGMEEILIQPENGVGSKWVRATSCLLVSDYWPREQSNGGPTPDVALEAGDGH